jgi:hypothetical protein
MGVEEYFAYDPNEPMLRKDSPRRLFGWQLDKTQGAMQAMPVGPGGRLWSRHLDSFLVPDGDYLRLYDRNGYLRLTRDEAEARRAQEERKRAEIATMLAEAANMRAEAEARRAEEERRRAEALAEKLRSLGIDPDQI